MLEEEEFPDCDSKLGGQAEELAGGWWDHCGELEGGMFFAEKDDHGCGMNVGMVGPTVVDEGREVQLSELKLRGAFHDPIIVR